MGFTFCLASLWALVGLSLLAFLWETLVYGEVPSGDKRKPEQGRDELGVWPAARSQGDSSRTQPHVRLVAIPLHAVSVSLLRTAQTRIVWRSPAEEWQMVFHAYGWDWTHGSLFLLPCTTIMKNVPFPKLYSLMCNLYFLYCLLRQLKQTKTADSV